VLHAYTLLQPLVRPFGERRKGKKKRSSHKPLRASNQSRPSIPDPTPKTTARGAYSHGQDRSPHPTLHRDHTTLSTNANDDLSSPLSRLPLNPFYSLPSHLPEQKNPAEDGTRARVLIPAARRLPPPPSLPPKRIRRHRRAKSRGDTKVGRA